MQRSGPLYTLLAGLALALIMLSLNATTGDVASSAPSTSSSPAPAPSPRASRTPPVSSTPSPSAPTPSTPSTASPRSAPPDADYAGRTADGAASVAVALRMGKAVAYVCDGRTKEAWLRGDVGDDGALRLTDGHGARLEGTLRGATISGDVRLTGLRQPFEARKAVKPSGLYRATASVRGAKVVGGWIVLQGGAQVGIVSRDGEPSAAPRIDTGSGAVTVDGERLTARPIP
ncbi:hypothetical protein ACFWVC_32440 [Streptomyces sp. NPDC058691]|uniref:hypothetical protein n=1 Tax=Streptomyces sp. NPDC058691 TaxID=3346601 RepID=UPI003656B6F3